MRWKWAVRKVVLIFIFIIFVLFFVFLFKFFLELFVVGDGDEDFNYDTLDPFDGHKNEIFVQEYLKLMQMGRAPVRPIVEKKHSVQEDYWCFLRHPKHVGKPRNWLKMAGIEVFSAYYDDRDNSLFPENSAIQLLVVSNHSIESSPTPFHCNIFKSPSTYATVKGYIREIWQTGWDPRDTYQVPSLITCPIPKRLDYASEMDRKWVVSLTRNPCHSVEVGMEVVMKNEGGGGEKKKDVVVCVKGLDYQNDMSGRLLEWLEMQYLFGADKVSIYTFYLTQETQKIINWYQKHKKLTVIPLSLPSGNPTDPSLRSEFLKNNRPQKRRHELIPYNDCFYSHIHTHRYVLIIDIDEVIVPVAFDNYSDLLHNFESNFNSPSGRRISSISSRNVFKFRSNFSMVPAYQYMISNQKRSKKTSPNGEYGKSFSSTSTVATVFNHFALHKLSPSVAKSQYFPATDALKLHYKSECPWESRNECHKLEYDVIDDTSLRKFEKELRSRVDRVVESIGL